MDALLDRLLDCLEYEKEDPSGAIEGSERTLQLIQALGETTAPAKAKPGQRDERRSAVPASSPPTPTATPLGPDTKNKPRANTDTPQPHFGDEPEFPARTSRAAPVPAISDSDGGTTMETIADQVRACVKCNLHKTRTKAVPGQGSFSPDIAFVGEAPGADEDEAGLAFVGRAGQLLTKMIEAMGYTREEVFIGNILKCRPPDNRKPTPAEMAVCSPYLREQLRRIQPKIIVTLGATAISGLLPDIHFEKMGDVRGRWLTYEGVPVMPTFHPAYLLRQESKKKEVWQDLQEVLKHLGKPVPPVPVQTKGSCRN